jgi:hypothetical protein
MKSKLYSLISLAIFLVISSCDKYLDVKPDDKLSVPQSLDELQGLLDNYPVLNQVSGGAGEACADNYYLTSDDWRALTLENQQRIYTWEKDFLFPQGSTNEWSVNYRAIYYANSVLKHLDEAGDADRQRRNFIEGQAYFYRGQYHLRTALLWAPAYEDGRINEPWGIPLKLSDNFNEETKRSMLGETYTQILSDLKLAGALLPTDSGHPARPSKAAAFGLLARTYLSMRKYQEAAAYADSSLQLHSGLMDFNELDSTENFPIKQLNREVIHWNRILPPSMLADTRARIPDALYQLYDEDDLRKSIFFRKDKDGSTFFKGYYEGLPAPFGGVASDEVLLMRAECKVRLGEAEGALIDLNTLLMARYKKGKFHGYEIGKVDDLLKIILIERRKQLLMRDLRWMDLKRLNLEGANITLQRSIDGKQFLLPPKDLRYVLPIPEDIVMMTGIAQNPS